MQIGSSIILTTLNARFSHCAFGLRYLYANLSELQDQAQILEFTINQNPRDIVEALLAKQPKIVGFGVYIWNTRQTLEVVSILKRVRPDLKIVLGGPEVSYETETQEICRLADLTIQGEADFKFYELCRDYLTKSAWPTQKWVKAEQPEIQEIKLPYRYYTADDIAHRVIYVEASRGCPYKCEYCLSSLDKSVRSFDLRGFLAEMDLLIQKGVRQFKFVDRTFNLSVATSTQILEFFLKRVDLGLFLHFEMVPDRLPQEIRNLIEKFPAGALQFEVGIQTWSPTVARLVSRRQDYAKIKENFEFLAKTPIHVHADLIAGLPGETLESFAAGFDAVSSLGPAEIQVGILKRLKGTPIIRHDQEWGMVYQEAPPFQVLQTRTMNFETLQGVVRFAHFWDLISNSGNFKRTLGLLRLLAAKRERPSLYHEFNDLVVYLAQRHPHRNEMGHGIALLNLLESVWHYLVEVKAQPKDQIRELLISDYTAQVKRDVPSFLKNYPNAGLVRGQESRILKVRGTPARQRLHLREELRAGLRAEARPLVLPETL